MFTFVPGIKKILLLQRNEYQSNLSRYLRGILGRKIHTRFLISLLNNNLQDINKKFYKDIYSEFNELKNFLPENANNILDIGCGVGAINIFLNNFYKGSASFHLIDKNYISRKITYGFKKLNTEGYNNLLVTKKFLQENNVIESNINTYDVDKNELKKIKYDLVISLLSWGYHYPLDTYIDYLKENSNNETIFIFDIAEEYVSAKDGNRYFKKIKFIKKYSKKQKQIRLMCTKIIDKTNL